MREAAGLTPRAPDGRRDRRFILYLALADTACMAAVATVTTLRAFGVRFDDAVPEAAVGVATDKPSLYALASFWTDDRGRKLRLLDLGGQFQVVALMFTRCPSACPTLVREIQSVERALPKAIRERTRFVLVSIDPDNDTPAVLSDYRRRMQLEGERWTLLTGSAESVRELSAVLGFSFAKDQAEVFSHTRLVTLLDPTGRIIHQQAGMNEDRQRFLNALDRGIASGARL